MPTPLEDLSNNFNGATLDPLWQATGGASQTEGAARLPTVAAYSSVQTLSASDYTLVGSSIKVELVSVPAVGGGSTQAMLALSHRSVTDGALQFGFQGSGAGPTMRGVVARPGPTFTNAFNIPYSSTDHRWLRLSESGGTVTYATSPDGEAWTARGNVLVSALGYSVSDFQVRMFSGHFAAETNLSPNFATFDNVNVTPASTTTTPISVSDYAGRIYAVEVRSSSGGDVVASADFTTPLAGTISVTGSTTEVWNLEGTAAIVPFGPSWVDISQRVTHASWEDGRDDELDPFPPGQGSLTLKNDDRAFDPENAAGPYAGKLLPRTPFRLRIPNDDSVLELAASTLTNNGGRAQTPSAPGLHPATGDLDVRIEATRDWALVQGLGEVLAARYQPAAGARSWWWALTRERRLRLRWSPDGNTPVVTATSFETVPAAAAQRGRLAVRATLEADNGFGQVEVRFYHAPEVTGPWTQLGDAITADFTTSVFDAAADLTVGSAHGGSRAFADHATFTGRVHAFQLLDDIDGDALANPDFTAQDVGATGFTDDAGNTWSVTPGDGDAEVIADDEPKDLFYGLAEKGFEQHFQYPAKGECEVELVDVLGVLHGTPLGKHAYEAEVLADEPVAYWPMDESEGLVMDDHSGNEHNGVFNNGEVGNDLSLVAGSEHSFRAPRLGGNHGRFQGESLPRQPPITVEAWIRTPRFEAVKTIVGIQRDFSTAVLWFLGIGATNSATFISPNGELLFVAASGGGSTRRVRGHQRIDDDHPHHVAVTIAANGALELYVDGIVQDQTVLSGTAIAPWSSEFLWTIGDLSNPVGDFGLDGNVGQVAVYDHVLDAERIAEHYRAGFDAFTNERSGERIRRIFRQAGVPAELTDVATGETTVGAAAFDNESVGDHANKVTESEQGFFYVNHRRGGRVTFRDRYTRHVVQRSATSQHDFTDADTADALHYERDGLEVTPNGVDGIVNVAEVQWRAGTETVSDTASVAAYGAQSRTLELDSPSARVARSAGGWLVLRYSQPQARVRGFALAPDADERVLPAALGMRISDRIGFTRHPLAVGDPVTNPLFIEGTSHETEGSHWETRVKTSSAEHIDTVWTWGEGAWDDTAIWG